MDGVAFDGKEEDKWWGRDVGGLMMANWGCNSNLHCITTLWQSVDWIWWLEKFKGGEMEERVEIFLMKKRGTKKRKDSLVIS